MGLRPTLCRVTFLVVAFCSFSAASSKAEVHLDTEHTHEVSASDVKAHAESLGHESHAKCPAPKSPGEILACVLEHHPAMTRAKLSAVHSDGLAKIARQTPNPEFDLESGIGDDNSGRRSEVQIVIAQPIEWGGKRSARIQEARARIEQVHADLNGAKAQVYIQTILNLHRLRQLEGERAVLEETAKAYQIVIRQQLARPALTPEQQVSLSVFKMAESDTKLRLSEINDEERSLEHFFHISTGYSLIEIRTAMPKAPEAWPDLGIPAKGGVSPELARRMADQKLAYAERSSAKARAWPQLRLGPMAILERDGNSSQSLLGVKLTMDLPVFNLNGGERAYASVGATNADRLIELTRAEESHERAEQLKIYQGAVKALHDVPDLKDHQKEHRRNELLARRGLVSASLVIESHRQQADLLKGRNARELRALEALWEIRRIDGNIFEVTP